jgi:hypothetical protein
MLLPIIPGQYDPVVETVKWLISHDEDGTPRFDYKFGDVGEGLHKEDCKTLSQFREDNGLSKAPIIDRELLNLLGIAEYNDSYDDIEYEDYEPFVLGTPWQLVLSIIILIFAVILFVF